MFCSSSSTFLSNMLKHKKVLIVLDDVDKFEQIEFLAGNHEWFGNGSRVLITSRDERVLQNGNVDSTYEVQQLVGHEALQLFSLFAFKQSSPPEDYLELSNRVKSFAKGLPLTLKVLGLFLHGKCKKRWQSALNDLQNTPYMEVLEVLKISYNGLDHNAKEVFLHIACFFRGEPKTDVERILGSCGFSTDNALCTLVERALIVISNFKVDMHDSLQEMGREIVRQELVEEPGERSRLWNPKDICRVLENNMGTKAIKGISLDMSKINNSVCVDPTAFSNMDQVKLLRLYFGHRWYNTSYSEFPKKVYFRQDLESLPKKLRYVRWDCYPLKALPSNIYSENLVELDICFSKIKRLWTGQQNLSSLIVLRVQECKRLKKMPDFSGALNLQIIEFTGCEMLPEVSPSIKYVKNLKELDLSGCQEIESLPTTKGLRSLTKLTLLGCIALKNLSKVSKSIEELDLEGASIEKVPYCSKLRSLKKLDLLGCSKLKKFPKLSMSVEELCLSHDHEHLYRSLEQSHKNLDLSGLKILRLLHWNELGNILKTNLGRLRELELSQSSFTDIGSIKDLSCLESLIIIGCTSLQLLREFPPRLKRLEARNCTGLQEVTDSKFALVETPVRLLDFKVDFSFFNCHKLNEDARRSVPSHAQQMIRIFSQEALKQLTRVSAITQSPLVLYRYHIKQITLRYFLMLSCRVLVEEMKFVLFILEMKFQIGSIVEAQDLRLPLSCLVICVIESSWVLFFALLLMTKPCSY
uniref:Protein SUPPRESSOR OF npr1-1 CONSTITUTIVE 1-like n=1 Tax=Rhizophora mucronata TaxID=61149 RepID=A0A2P2LWH6_RHIMU